METQEPVDTSSVPWDKVSGRIAFVNLDEGKYSNGKHLYLIDGTNRSVQIIQTSSKTYFDNAIISPAGSQVAYNDIDGLHVISLIDNSTAFYPSCYNPSYTRDNELVYYYVPSGTREIMVDGVSLDLPLEPASRIDFGPNDEFLVYGNRISDSCATLVLFDFRDSTYRTLTDSAFNGIWITAANPAISPDGSRILYSRLLYSANQWREIWIVNADGSDNTMLLSTTSYHNDFPMWSPDSKYFVYSSSYSPPYFVGGYDVHRRVGIFELATNTTEELLNINGYYASWSKQ